MGGKPNKSTRGKPSTSNCLILDLSQPGYEKEKIPEYLRESRYQNLVELRLSDISLCAKLYDVPDYTLFREIIPIIGNLKKLKKLYMSSNQVKNKGCEFMSNFIANSQTLEFLNLRSNFITSKGAKFLAKALGLNSSLKTLILDDNRVYFFRFQILCFIYRIIIVILL